MNASTSSEMHDFSKSSQLNFKEQTINSAKNRKNQSIKSHFPTTNLFKALYCLASPFSCCTVVQVDPWTDVIVTNCGVPRQF